MAMGLKSGVRAGLPKVLKGTPRLNMARATAINNRRGTLELMELEFFVSQVWRVPTGVKSLVRLLGLGGAGSPGGSSYEYGLYRNFIVKYDSPEYGQDSTNQTFQGYVTSPVNYCDPPIYYPVEHATTTYCYNTSEELVSYPATTGASATGFNRTFPGGLGGPASPAEYLAVPVTTGEEVSLIIPAGGYIKIAFLAR